MKKIGLNGTSVQRIGTVIACKCPHCGHDGSFELVADLADVQGLYHHDGRADGYVVGIRRCPRPECQGQLFFSSLGGEMDFYPVQRIDFDTTDVPQAVADCLKEAIDCHANGNEVAAAIMVRKTLEQLCSDRGATGDNLKAKVRDLGSKIVIPQALIDGMDTLRLLGNEAAHIEANVFSQIGTQELEVAIRFTKELLKNAYQYGSLLKELEALKNAT